MGSARSSSSRPLRETASRLPHVVRGEPLARDAPRGAGARLPVLENPTLVTLVLHYGLASFNTLFGGIVGAPLRTSCTALRSPISRFVKYHLQLTSQKSRFMGHKFGLADFEHLDHEPGPRDLASQSNSHLARPERQDPRAEPHQGEAELLVPLAGPPDPRAEPLDPRAGASSSWRSLSGSRGTSGSSCGASP